MQKASRSSGSASDKGSGGLQLALCSGSLRRNRAARRDPSFSSTSSSYSTRLHIYHDVELLFLKAIFTALPWAVGRVALPSGCQIQRQRGRSSSLAARKRPDPLQPSQLTPAAGSPPALWASPVSFGRVLILRFMNNAAPSACTDSRDCSSQQDTPETPLPSVPSNGSSKASWPLLSDRRRTTPSKELPIHQYHIKIYKL